MAHTGAQPLTNVHPNSVTLAAGRNSGDGEVMEAPVEASVGAQKNVDLAMEIVGAP